MSNSEPPSGGELSFEAVAVVLSTAETLSRDELMFAAGALWQKARDLSGGPADTLGGADGLVVERPLDMRLLRLARHQNGHSQAECAQFLQQLGVSGADQSAISKWEQGRRSPRRETEAIVRKYIALTALPEDALIDPVDIS